MDLLAAVHHSDLDHDGAISLEELGKMVRHTMGVPHDVLPDKHVKKLFDFIDTDQSGYISAHEVIAFCSQKFEATR